MNELFTTSGPEKFQSAISQLYLLSGEGEVITLQHLKQAFPDRRSQFAIEQNGVAMTTQRCPGDQIAS